MQTLLKPVPSPDYEEDVVRWLDKQIQLLLEQKFSELDIDNLVEELDGMKKQYAHEMDSRLTVLIMHLLKCEFQKDHPQNKWRSTIIEQRYRLSRLLASAPSLRKQVPQFALECYPTALRRAALETSLPVSGFPVSLPYTIEQLLDQDFMP